MKSCTKLLAALYFSLIGLAAPNAEALTLGEWTIGGPGVITKTPVGADGATITYEATRFDGEPVTFFAEALVEEGGVFNYRYDYSGFHAFFNVTAFLQRTSPGGAETLYSAGPQNCCTSPSSGFSISDFATVTLATGDTLRFVFGGDNFDSNPTIRGSLTIAAVPVPAAGLLLLSAVGLVISMRRRTA
ncbi:MAG: hypothetical protein ACK5MQ_17345 [Pikeienuella sp.]